MALLFVTFFRYARRNGIENFHWIRDVGNDFDRTVGFTGGHDFQKLKDWNLIEPDPRKPLTDKKKTSGRWRVTTLGVDFVANRARLPEYVFTHGGEVVGYSEKRVKFSECFGNDFSYAEVMKGIDFTEIREATLQTTLF